MFLDPQPYQQSLITRLFFEGGRPALRPTSTIVVSDHDAATITLIADMLSSEGYTVYCHPSHQLTVDAIMRLGAQVVLIELSPVQPEYALQLLEALRYHPSTCDIGMLVTSTDEHLLSRYAGALEAAGSATLRKPFHLDELYDRVQGLLQSGSTQRRTLCVG